MLLLNFVRSCSFNSYVSSQMSFPEIHSKPSDESLNYLLLDRYSGIVCWNQREWCTIHLALLFFVLIQSKVANQKSRLTSGFLHCSSRVLPACQAAARPALQFGRALRACLAPTTQKRSFQWLRNRSNVLFCFSGRMSTNGANRKHQGCVAKHRRIRSLALGWRSW